MFAATVGMGQGIFEVLVADVGPEEIRLGAMVGVAVAGLEVDIVDGLCVGEACDGAGGGGTG